MRMGPRNLYFNKHWKRFPGMVARFHLEKYQLKLWGSMFHWEKPGVSSSSLLSEHLLWLGVTFRFSNSRAFFPLRSASSAFPGLVFLIFLSPDLTGTLSSTLSVGKPFISISLEFWEASNSCAALDKSCKKWNCHLPAIIMEAAFCNHVIFFSYMVLIWV